MESQLAKAEVEIKGLGQTVQRLELENKQLVEKLLDMEQRQVNIRQTTMACFM